MDHFRAGVSGDGELEEEPNRGAIFVFCLLSTKYEGIGRRVGEKGCGILLCGC